MSSHPLLSHLLNRLTADLDFLAAQNYITPQDLSAIKEKLPGPNAVPHQAGAGQGLSGMKCRALWDLHSNQPDDLSFSKGDIITIEAEMGPEWWRGSCNGRSGVFPSNYVEKLDSTFNRGNSTPTPSFDSGYHSNPSYPSPAAPWNGPGGDYSHPPYQPSYAPPQNQYDPYAKPPQQYQQPPPQNYAPQPPQPPPQAAPAAGPPPPIPEKKKFGGKLGGMMASSFAGGIGFGAGSAIASDAIHAIF